MRVQAKSPYSGPMYTVVEESPNYYIARDSVGFLINLHKSEYEPVREWVDVTHECEMRLIGETYRIYHGGTWLGDASRYRVKNPNNLSKVRVEVKR